MSKIFGNILGTATDKVSVTAERFLPLEHNEKKQNISETPCKIKKNIRHYLKTRFDISSDIFSSNLYEVQSRNMFLKMHIFFSS